MVIKLSMRIVRRWTILLSVMSLMYFYFLSSFLLSPVYTFLNPFNNILQIKCFQSLKNPSIYFLYLPLAFSFDFPVCVGTE